MSPEQRLSFWQTQLKACRSNILDQDEMLLNGGDIHADALKKRA